MEKTTWELLELMKQSRDYRDYIRDHAQEITGTHMRIDQALAVLMRDRDRKKAEIIARSGIEPHYAYQIFSGLKSPNRDKVIMLCFGFEMTAEEAIRFMKITGYAPLYAKEERDNAILYGLTKKLGIVGMNTLLDELHLDLLL